MAVDRIFDERLRQEIKWGEQHHTNIEWLMILLGELGEWVEEFDFEDEQMSIPWVWYAVGQVKKLGVSARMCLRAHEWPKRQQQVFDKEKEAT